MRLYNIKNNFSLFLAIAIAMHGKIRSIFNTFVEKIKI